jgi:hypothetical protein
MSQIDPLHLAERRAQPAILSHTVSALGIDLEAEVLS